MPKLSEMPSIQVFGVKSSQPTRAAERFFKERRIPIQMIDLKVKPLAPGEIKRFIDRFTLAGLVDNQSSVYADAGLKYLRVSDSELMQKIEREPKLLRLPLVRCGNQLSMGHDEAAWKAMAAS